MHTQGEARNAVRARIVRASAHPTRVFLVEQAINELGVEAELEKVTDIGQITSFGVMMTPALAVDGEVKVVGKIASPEEIKAVLRDHFATVETVGHANQIVFEQDVVFLALHPPAIPEVLASLPQPPRAPGIVLSLAPKITWDKLTDLLGGFDRVARVIPNAPSIVAAGFNPTAYSAVLSQDDRKSCTISLAARWAIPASYF